MAPSLVAPSPVSLAVVIVAAGRGRRVGGTDGLPKQYLMIGGKAVLRWTLEVFAQRADVCALQVVIHPDDRDLYEAALKGAAVTGGEDVGLATKLRPPVHGGATRQASVLAGLEALASWAPDLVLIQDAARPFTTASGVDGVVAALGTHAGAIAAVAATDSLKIAGDGGTITGIVPREAVWRAQTPQGFRFGAILAAHRQAAQAGGGEFTDDAAVFQAAGGRVVLVPSGGHNMKITTAEDVAMAERLLAGEAAETRTGQGFDVHRFMAGDHVWLCGVRVPHSQALEGHSDADVGLHALTDALLGAIGDGDIGQHFPPSDPQWKGAASHLFLADAARRVRARGGRIFNVDVTLLCEVPKIAPHRVVMQNRIAEILAVSVDRVGVKATTTEGLGFTGRREGIAAMAIATVRMPAA